MSETPTTKPSEPDEPSPQPLPPTAGQEIKFDPGVAREVDVLECYRCHLFLLYAAHYGPQFSECPVCHAMSVQKVGRLIWNFPNL